MEEGQVFRVGEEVFCSYYDDDNLVRNGYFFFVKLNDTSVILKSQNGTILLFPISRLLKIKQKSEGKNGN